MPWRSLLGLAGRSKRRGVLRHLPGPTRGMPRLPAGRRRLPDGAAAMGPVNHIAAGRNESAGFQIIRWRPDALCSVEPHLEMMDDIDLNQPAELYTTKGSGKKAASGLPAVFERGGSDSFRHGKSLAGNAGENRSRSGRITLRRRSDQRTLQSQKRLTAKARAITARIGDTHA